MIHEMRTNLWWVVCGLLCEPHRRKRVEFLGFLCTCRCKLRLPSGTSTKRRRRRSSRRCTDPDTTMKWKTRCVGRPTKDGGSIVENWRIREDWMKGRKGIKGRKRMKGRWKGKEGGRGRKREGKGKRTGGLGVQRKFDECVTVSKYMLEYAK